MASRIAYFDPVAGAAGDMINAALLDAGADLAAVQAAISGIAIAGLRVSVSVVMKGAIGALKFVVAANEAELPDHLGPDDLLALIARARVSATVQRRASAIIERLAEAEAQVHRVPRAEVHFHELGGLDTVADVLGAMVALESLGIEQCFTGPLPASAGLWGMAHGPLPLPAPATLEIIARGGLAVVAAPAILPRDMELVTPTGAAILAEVARPGLPAMTVARVGYGAGTRDLPIPNVVRVWVGELLTASPPSGEAVTERASHIEQGELG
ncbi:MAG: LarC family nickel insertion protein [Ktedonobacterales bacterium]|nr:LarC family nickel insertion protein [Ktedonobacterales bacterium]